MMEWIKKEPKGLKLLGFLLLCVIVNYINGITAMVILTRYHTKLPSQTDDMSLLVLALLMPIMAFAEEICFRVPLFLPLSQEKNKGVLTLLTAIFLSAIFGLAHGSIYNCFIQGITGLVLSLVYVKSGGWNGNFKKALFSSFSVHLIFNLSIVALLLVVKAIKA